MLWIFLSWINMSWQHRSQSMWMVQSILTGKSHSPFSIHWNKSSSILLVNSWQQRRQLDDDPPTRFEWCGVLQLWGSNGGSLGDGIDWLGQGAAMVRDRIHWKKVDFASKVVQVLLDQIRVNRSCRDVIEFMLRPFGRFVVWIRVFGRFLIWMI